MILTLAWRNIWRNKIRSGTVVLSIVLGVWALIFALAFIKGTIDGYINGAIENEVSHLQLHHPTYVEKPSAQYLVPNLNATRQVLKALPEGSQYSFRSVNTSLLHQGGATKGVQVRGIDPAQEATVTRLNEKIVAGTYLNAQQSGRPILLSERLGEQLGAAVGTALTLRLQRPDGVFVESSGTVVGWYKTGNLMLDGQRIFMRQQDVEQTLSTTQWIHEVAVVLPRLDDLKQEKARLTAALPEVLVQSYDEVSPSIKLYETQIAASSYVLIFIIMLALIFGIINTMLMAILERSKELGMLLAVGMKRGQVFWMVVLETLLLAVLAAPLGLLLGAGTVAYLGAYGFDMSSYEEAMNSVGMSGIIYPSIDGGSMMSVVVALFLTALVAALYPAYKATRLQPIEAMRRL